jgi:4-amino-4-deoxy-L-arabinose transferase-like glycosyltransferase
VIVEPARRRRIRPDTYLFFLALFAFVVFLSHAPWLRLPYYWDELGQFIPAALDIFHGGFQAGSWIPHSTVPNVHPPGVMAYLAVFWTVAGCSPLSTRIAMLLAASVALLVAFLLAIELCRNVRGAPAFMAVLLLCCSPLFFAQAMLAQLDMPAMLFTCLALLLFVQDKPRLAALACTALVLVKETGLLAPLLFGVWLLYEKRRRDAAWFLLPAAALCGWLLILAHGTGHLFGNSEFTRYNLYYPFHPVRFAFALGRRLYYLFFQDFHWIGTIAIVLAARRAVFATRAWRIAWLMIGIHVLFLSAVGGAMLERYLLPVLPVVYAAMVAAMSIYKGPLRVVCQIALLAGLIVGNFWNPPYPFPFENNLAFTDFVRLQQTAAEFVARNYAGERVATVWPLTSALSRPEFGYVSRAIPVHSLPDFTAHSVDSSDWQHDARVFIFFSRMWEPEWSWTNIELVRKVWRRFYGYEPELTIPEMRSRPLTPVARWQRRGQWIEVYVGQASGLSQRGNGCAGALGSNSGITRPSTSVNPYSFANSAAQSNCPVLRITSESPASAAAARPIYSGDSLRSKRNCFLIASVVMCMSTRSVRMKPGLSPTTATFDFFNSWLMPITSRFRNSWPRSQRTCPRYAEGSGCRLSVT